MQGDDAALFESILRDMAQKLSSLVEDVNLARRVLAGRRSTDPHAPSAQDPPDGLADEGRFAVRWRGRECRLGNTVSFRLFHRLAAARNRYVTHDDLLSDVWDGEERSPSAIRSAVGELRRRLVEGGMEDLAAAIDGRNPGHYGLLLERIPPPRGSDSDPTRIRPPSDSPGGSSGPSPAPASGRRNKS